jgi:hypothetical protein
MEDPFSVGCFFGRSYQSLIIVKMAKNDKLRIARACPRDMMPANVLERFN